MKEDYDEFYDIRLATLQDIPSIMRFIDEHWRKGHIMATNRKMFEYEYVHGDDVDFVIAVKKATGTIEAIFGFLRCSRERTGDVWGSMWMVNDESPNLKLLGIEIAKRVYTLTGCRFHIGNGANPKTTIPLRKIFFREKTGKMRQFYWLNYNRDTYSIARINSKWVPEKKVELPSYKLKKFMNYTALKNKFDIEKVNGIPHKDGWYLNHRFFEHPKYHYDVYGICDDNQVFALLVTREIDILDSAILRIVDYIGEHKAIEGLYDEFYRLVSENNYEYIDFFEYGIDDEMLLNAGFRDREDFDNIIPNYFEPFLQENIDIWVHYKDDNTTFFKADGDQDRPNLE